MYSEGVNCGGRDEGRAGAPTRHPRTVQTVCRIGSGSDGSSGTEMFAATVSLEALEMTGAMGSLDVTHYQYQNTASLQEN